MYTEKGHILIGTSHHPVHVKRGVVRSLFDRAERVTTTSEDLRNENSHLKNVFEANGYPRDFVDDSLSNRSRATTDLKERDRDEKFLTIPYVSGVSENIRRICRGYGIKVAFRSSNTLRQHLTRVKGRLPLSKQSRIVYSVPCSCGKSYIGETIRRLDTRLEEHREACKRGETDKSAVAEHVWSEQHQMDWAMTSVIDRAEGRMELVVKEALHIGLRSGDELMNRDKGMDLPGCWLSVVKTFTN